MLSSPIPLVHSAEVVTRSGVAVTWYSTLSLGSPGAGTVELSARGYSTDLVQLSTIAAGGGYTYARLTIKLNGSIVASSSGTSPITASTAIAFRPGWG